MDKMQVNYWPLIIFSFFMYDTRNTIITGATNRAPAQDASAWKHAWCSRVQRGFHTALKIHKEGKVLCIIYSSIS